MPYPSGRIGSDISMRRSLRILAVDADPQMSRFYQEALPSLGHEVCVVASGHQAIELCRSALPDFVITEIKLPDITGFDMAAALCQNRSLPVIVVAHGETPEFIEGL